MKILFKSAMVAIACITLFIAGCSKKNAASLVGTWSRTTMHAIQKVNNVTVMDTTANVPAGSTVTFTAAGHYETTDGGSSLSGGSYIQSNDRLLLLDSVGNPGMNFYMHDLADHSLTLETRDTSTTQPITVVQYFYGLTR
ncbi:MAG: hypothetical protein JWO03_2957 [Bacteroidetes bacterium]|nr:hypothetical protein [Bacteroidota bacterium]